MIRQTLGVAVVATLLLSSTAKAQESIGVVETFRITGSFKARHFDVTVAGRTLGPRESIPLLAKSSASLYACTGSGLVFRDHGALALMPLDNHFEVHCRMAAPNKGDLIVTAAPSVLFPEATLDDGESDSVITDDGSHTVTLSRVLRPRPSDLPAQGTAPAEPRDAVAVGRYRIALAPGKADFKYQLDVRNPNSSPQPFVLSLKSGESVAAIDTTANYEPLPGGFRFTLPPGDTTLVVSGQLAGNTFVPPADASASYLLLEVHPLLRLTLNGDRRRISPQETGLTAQYRGAQALLLAAGESVDWTVAPVEVLPSQSYSVPAVEAKYYVTRDGRAVGETDLTIQNVGAPDLAVPVAGTPTAASIDGAPVLLTKNAAGDFWTTLSTGVQRLNLQEWQPLKRRFGFGWGTLSLPRVAAPAGELSVALRYPWEWTPLFERFRGEIRLPSLDTRPILWAALLCLWTWLTSPALGLRGSRRGAVAIAGGLSVVCSTWLAAAVATANAVILLATILPRFRVPRHFGEYATLTVIAVIVTVGVVTVFGEDTRTLFGASTQALAGRTTVNSVAKSRAFFGNNSGNGNNEGELRKGDYQGLPARVDLPVGERTTTFRSEMLDLDRQNSVEVFMVGTWLVDLLTALLTLVAAGILAREARNWWTTIGRLRAAAAEEDPAGLPSPA